MYTTSHSLSFATKNLTPSFSSLKNNTMFSFISRRDLGLSVLFFVVVVDQISKHFMLNAPMPLPQDFIPPFLSLTLAWNPGMSFSFMADFIYAKEALSTIAILASIIFIFWMGQKDVPRPALHQFSLGMITGGAIGNVIDRFQFGAVVDFFHLHWGDLTLFIFNGADAFISLGVALLFVESFLPSGEKKR